MNCPYTFRLFTSASPHAGPDTQLYIACLPPDTDLSHAYGYIRMTNSHTAPSYDLLIGLNGDPKRQALCP